MKELILQLEEYMILKNFSKSTIKCYMSAVRNFFIWCKKESMKPGYDKSNAHRKYLVDRHRVGKAWQTVNGDYSGIKMLYVNILNREWDEEKLPRPRKEKYLPTILSKEEVKRMIISGRIYKHRMLMALLYGTGLRVGEAVSLEQSDVDLERMQVHVKKGKGGKDRYVKLAEGLRNMLVDYYEKEQPLRYVFNGKYRTVRMSIRAAQQAIEEARKDSGIIKRVSAHTFRHCYATHHLEVGTDLVTLQKQLGHKHLRTTGVYVHLSKEHYQNIHHPINDLDLCLKNTSSDILCENMESNIFSNHNLALQG